MTKLTANQAKVIRYVLNMQISSFDENSYKFSVIDKDNWSLELYDVHASNFSEVFKAVNCGNNFYLYYTIIINCVDGEIANCDFKLWTDIEAEYFDNVDEFLKAYKMISADAADIVRRAYRIPDNFVTYLNNFKLPAIMASDSRIY